MSIKMKVKDNGVISLKWYVDPAMTAIEQKKLMESDIYYLGHRSNVTRAGDYFALPSTENSKVLILDDQTPRVVSNICRHRQAELLSGKGNIKGITCPIHSWRYALDGTGISAHHFENYTCPSLEQTPTTLHKDFLFRQSENVQKILSGSKQFTRNADASFQVMSVEALTSNYNWKIFMETYLDLYHIRSIHPGLRKFANCEHVEWEIKDLFSSQTVGIFLDETVNPSPHYKEYIRLIKAFSPKPEDLRITWFSIYPNVMIEFYPFNLVTSLVIPLGPEETLNVVEFMARKDILDHPDGPALHEAFKKSYLETAAEDDVACRKIQVGRNNLARNLKEDYGPYHEPLELGIPSFYEYALRNIMNT